MKVAILGAGVVGVTSAWYLMRAGHDVIVVEREPGPALETSYANGGQVSWGYATPWASPGVIGKLISWQFDPNSPLRLHFQADYRMWRFLIRMLVNAAPATYKKNKSILLRLGLYSYQMLSEIRQLMDFDYERGPGGLLEIIREKKDLDHVDRELEIYAANGIPAERLDLEGCLKVEPGLDAGRDVFVGGIYFPGDESGNCQLFTQRLSELAAEEGVSFNFGITVERLAKKNGRITAFETEQGAIEADAYVIAAGSYSSDLLRPLGMDIPIYPVKGYSMTAPIVDASQAPKSTLMDENRKVAITRLGSKLRAAGIAEFTGFDLSLQPKNYQVVARAVQELFPNAADYSNIDWWCGFRPMTPDGPPIIGSTPYQNLYLNTGHGTLGWTLSCGSARVLADIVSAKAPAIDMEGLTLERYG